MKNSWLLWIFVTGVVVTVLFAFNYQGSNNRISLDEIFPDEQTYPVEIEYEFVNQEGQPMITRPKLVPQKKGLQEDDDRIVVTKVINPEPKVKVSQINDTQKESVTALSKATYTIQVASFYKQERAQVFLKEMKRKNYKAYIKSRDLGDKGVWYRVYVGKFYTKGQAQEYLVTFKEAYKDSFIISIP